MSKVSLVVLSLALSARPHEQALQALRVPPVNSQSSPSRTLLISPTPSLALRTYPWQGESSHFHPTTCLRRAVLNCHSHSSTTRSSPSSSIECLMLFRLPSSVWHLLLALDLIRCLFECLRNPTASNSRLVSQIRPLYDWRQARAKLICRLVSTIARTQTTMITAL